MSMSITKVSQSPSVTPASGNTGEQETAIRERQAVQEGEAVSAKVAETNVNDANKKEKASGPSKEEIEKAVEQFNAASEYFGNQIELHIHEETQRYKIDIVDKETKKVISEFPPEEILDLVARFKDMMGVVISGLFLDKKV